jgi:hypothetical protein
VPTLGEVYQKVGEVSEAAQLLERELGTMRHMNRAAVAGLFGATDPIDAANLPQRD